MGNTLPAPGTFKPGIEIINFQAYAGEAVLYNSTICEYTDMAGFKVHYYIHDPSNIDTLYGEDPMEGYHGPFITKISYQPEKEANVIDQFGISSADTVVNAEIPKTIFTRDVCNTTSFETSGASGSFLKMLAVAKPKPKDVIRTLWNNKLYEIADQTDENKVFLGNKLIWTLTLRPYRHGEQSDSADAMLYTLPPSADMPLINYTTATLPLSAYGDNIEIEN